MSSPHRPKSSVWRYFKENDVDKSRATCELCNETVCRGGMSAASLTMSNLWLHLQRKHKVQHDAIKAEEKVEKASSASRVDSPGLSPQP